MSRSTVNTAIHFDREAIQMIYRNANVRVDWKKKYGDPAPLALAGFVMALTPLACQLMEWRGSDGSGAANNGVHFFCGGLLMLLGGILEFFRGETFSFVVFGSYGGFFAALGATIAPGFGALSAYVEKDGSISEKFYSSYGFFYLWMSMLSFIFLLCALRTNICLIGIFLSYTVAFPLLAASDWVKANGDKVVGRRLQIGAGAACFTCALFGWYVLFASLLVSVKSPISLPLGNLSTSPSAAPADEENRDSRSPSAGPDDEMREKF